MPSFDARRQNIGVFAPDDEMTFRLVKLSVGHMMACAVARDWLLHLSGRYVGHDELR
jgi:hypothetical protein